MKYHHLGMGGRLQFWVSTSGLNCPRSSISTPVFDHLRKSYSLIKIFTHLHPSACNYCITGIIMLVVWQNIMRTMTSLLLRCVADGIMEFAGGQSLILTHSPHGIPVIPLSVYQCSAPPKVFTRRL